MSATPAQPRSSLFRRITSSVPLLVTVLVHVVLIAIAGYFVVSEQITGKKKSFEAPPPSDNTAVQKQVEHRLQVARKGGGSASSSPVSASRIMSTSADALQMPAMPDLPQVGASSLSGMGFGAGMGAVGMGSGYNTGVGNGNGLGKGFMSMSFLGITSQRSQKVVFVVEVGNKLLDIRKGGFQAFAIIRDQMMRLVAGLPPAAEFGVVLFDSGDWDVNASVKLFRKTLLPATLENKTQFIAWMKPINADPKGTGLRTINDVVDWKFVAPPNAGLKADYRPTAWVSGFHAALELKPDTIFVITGSNSFGVVDDKPADIAKRQRDREQYRADLKHQGIDLNEAVKARQAAERKAGEELQAINKQLIAKGKDPFVITNNGRIRDADFQAALKKAGYSITMDTTGWKDKDGKLILSGSGNVPDWTWATLQDMQSHISRLQRALTRDGASLNIFLFIGPDQNADKDSEILTKFARSNSGRFEILTTKRLEEIKARAAEADKKK